MKKSILIDGYINKQAVKHLKKSFKVLISKEHNKNDLLKKIKSVDGIILKTAHVSNQALDTAKRLKVISRFGVGYDNLDLNYLKKKYKIKNYC